MEVGNLTKAATFKSFFHLSYKNTQLLFSVAVLFNVFMRQTLTNAFWGLNKNMNCAFPLNNLFYESGFIVLYNFFLSVKRDEFEF